MFLQLRWHPWAIKNYLIFTKFVLSSYNSLLYSALFISNFFTQKPIMTKISTV